VPVTASGGFTTDASWRTNYNSSPGFYVELVAATAFQFPSVKSDVGDVNYFSDVLKMNFDTGTVRSLGQRGKPSHFLKVYEKFYIFEPDSVFYL
jgi:hypothetical protein